MPTPIPALLSREAFVQTYMPKYAGTYRPPSGIRLRPDGHPMMTTRGSVQAQLTKRDNRINAAYAAYCADHAAQIAFDAKCAGLVPVNPDAK